METNKVLDINSETAAKYIPIFEDVFLINFHQEKTSKDESGILNLAHSHLLLDLHLQWERV